MLKIVIMAGVVFAILAVVFLLLYILIGVLGGKKTTPGQTGATPATTPAGTPPTTTPPTTSWGWGEILGGILITFVVLAIGAAIVSSIWHYSASVEVARLEKREAATYSKPSQNEVDKTPLRPKVKVGQPREFQVPDGWKGWRISGAGNIQIWGKRNIYEDYKFLYHGPINPNLEDITSSQPAKVDIDLGYDGRYILIYCDTAQTLRVYHP